MDTATSSVPDVPAITPAELRALQGCATAPLLLDVRRPAAFAQSPHLLAGARYCAPEAVQLLAHTEPPREVVVYCVYGHGVGAQAARTLGEAGWPARYVAGGMLGGEPGVDAPEDIARWRAQPPLTIRKRDDLGVSGDRPSRWITRERPKIDRVACPWLIRRFIDPRAEFVYVPACDVAAEARRLAAVPFDVEGAPISHEWERCSFDALIAAFGLQDGPLHALATIVRGADTARPSLAPEAAGLLALSLGLSRLHARDDHAMLEAAMPVYDALYAWCAALPAETHTWRAHGESTPA